MAPKRKQTPSDGKLRPVALRRAVSFGEERNGTQRVTKPGTSPTTPKGKRYGLTSPPLPKKIVKTTSKKNSNAGNLTSALAVKIRKLPDGSLSFTSGGRKWESIVPLNDVKVATTTTISSPTGGFKNLPSILHGGVNYWKNGSFKFSNTSGWSCVSRKDESDLHEEEWIYVGEDSAPTTPKTPPTTPKNQKNNSTPSSPPPPPKKNNNFVDPNDDDLTNWVKLYPDYYFQPHPRKQPGFKFQSNNGSPKLSPKAAKNKKERGKKALAKKNRGKRQKVPYIPEQELEKTKRDTRSKQTSQFFALP